MYLTFSLEKTNANNNALKKDFRVYIRYQKFDYKSNNERTLKKQKKK